MRNLFKEWLGKRQEPRGESATKFGSVAAMLPQLQQMDGTDFVWVFKVWSHGMAGMACLQRPRGQREVQFSSAYRTNVPLVMRRVHFSLATPQQVQEWAALGENGPKFEEDDQILAISCDEGTFFVECLTVAYRLFDDTQLFDHLASDDAKLLLPVD